MSRIRTNTIALGTSFFATAFLAFIQVKIITNFLDQGSVGIWSAVIAIGALLTSVSEMGLPWVLVRYGAKYDAENRLARLSKLWFFAVRMSGLGVLVMLGILILAGPELANLLGEGQIDRRLLMLGYLTVATGSLRAFNNASFRGLRRMIAVAAVEISFALTVTLLWYVFRHDLSVTRVFTISLLSSLFWAGVGIFILLRIYSRVRAKALPEVLSGSVVPEIKGYWRGAAASGIFLVAIEQLDKPLLAALISFDELAVFHVASRLALFARRLMYVPFQVMNPEITHKWESGRRDELRADMELFSKLTLGLGLLLVVLLGVFARPLLLLISTSEFLGGAPVLWVFTAVLPLLCLHQPMVMFLRATGRVWYSFVGDASWLILYLGVGSLLVTRFGLPGFVSGQIVASSVILVYNLVVFHRLGLPRPSNEFFLKRVLLGAVVWSASMFAGRALPDWSWWQLVLLAGGLGLIGNFLVVRGRFLSPAEEDRAVAMMAGRGMAGRVVRYLFTWPYGGSRPVAPRGEG